MLPDTRYANSGDVHIAYQTLGEGPFDLVVFLGFLSHAAEIWEEPSLDRFLRRLASFSRIILFDKRGVGLSDPVPTTAIPILEQWMDDTSAVLDAAGAHRVALLGHGTGGQIATVFAATYPQRTTHLILANTFPRSTQTLDYPWGILSSLQEPFLARSRENWGSVEHLALLAPSVAGDRRVQEWWTRYQRLAASPGTAASLQRAMFEIDTRRVLSMIQVPTLVTHSRNNRYMPAAHGRYLSESIPGARYVELDAADHWIWTDGADRLLDEIEEFLTGARPSTRADRMLATVLFTDIAHSTEWAVKLGDRRWRDLLQEHDAMVRRQLVRFRGREVNTTGDGFLAVFDGPGRAIECAVAIRDAAQRLGIEVRAGLHAGECEVRGADIGGIAVHIGARVAATAAVGEVLVSSTVKDLVAGSAFRFTDRGGHTLKGVPGEWQLYAVEP